jgi:hypothetical protein
MDDQAGINSENMTGRWPLGPEATSAQPALAAPNVEEMSRIYSLLDRLDGGNQVRRLAEEVLNRNDGEIASLNPVIQPLIRPNRSQWRERQVAAWLLGVARMDGKDRQFAIESLIKLLEGRLEPDFYTVLRQGVKRACILAAIVALPLPVRQMFFDDGSVSMIGAFLQALVCTGPFIVLASAVYTRITSKRIAAEAARSLGNLRATEALDVLVSAAQGGRRRRRRSNRRIRQTAMEALPSVLATITEAHYGNIRSETMLGLCRLLQYGDETLAVAILGALAQIGDNMALGIVEKLAAGGGRASYEPRVQNAAQLALPQIQMRISRARDSHQLLRGASMPATPVEQLLRPSAETSVTDPLELLRASADPNWKGTEEDVAFVVRILKHLQQSGDTRALIYVEQIADGANLDARIRNAATECLPVLRAHRELERYSPKPVEQQPNVLGLQ